MSHPPHRVELGERFSEGARLLWKVLDDKRCSQLQLQRELGEHAGVVNRLLYGDRLPSLETAVRIEALYGIPVNAWNEAPKKKFMPPAAKAS